jgi:hypothetical protein
MHVNPLVGFPVNPSANYATTCKYKSMWTVVIDDGEFKITVKWRFRYIFPHWQER